jgi:hypothetical protein
MNKFRKYFPNVWIAECEEEHEKGDIIQLVTKYGKEVPCKVYNLIGKNSEKYFYSIVRIEDQTYAQRKAEKYNTSAANHTAKSNQYFEASNEGREFLSLGEPIKVGHHSEKRHRALIERNNRRMEKSIELAQKAEEMKHKAEYWESKAKEITLAMPESLGYFQAKLEKAIAHHKGLKDGSIPRSHSYSLQYAAKEVKELKKKVEIAQRLWG